MDKVVAVIVAGSVGLLIGLWQGRGGAEDNFRRMVLLADLTPECEQMLSDGVDPLNEAGEAQRQADRDFAP